MRFALLEVKVALMSVVRHFNLTECSKTVQTIELDPKAGVNFTNILWTAFVREHPKSAKRLYRVLWRFWDLHSLKATRRHVGKSTPGLGGNKGGLWVKAELRQH